MRLRLQVHRFFCENPCCARKIFTERVADLALPYARRTTRLLEELLSDVKPENMLLGPSNQVLLSDFGIAVAAHRTQSLHTQNALGTIAYMAPEQAEGKARTASDQYALAVCVYEWLSGRLPFSGTSTLEIALKHQRQPSPFLKRNKNPHIYSMLPDIQEVVMKALAKDPRDRFAHILAFAETLANACTEDDPDVPCGSVLTCYRGHVAHVLTLAWSPNGQWIASGGVDGTVQIWEAKTGKIRSTYLSHKAEVNTLAWSPDGTHLVSGSEDQTLHVWHASTGKQMLTYRGHTDGVDAVTWSPDGTRIASGSSDRTIQIWDATKRLRISMF